MNSFLASLHIPALLVEFNHGTFAKEYPKDYQQVVDFVNFIPGYLTEGKSILFRFPTPVLNSQLAVYLLQEVIKRDFLDVDYVIAEQVVVSFKNTWSNSVIDLDHDYNRLLDRDFLVIDSIVAEYLDAFGSRVFCQFLEKRLLNKKSTVITDGNVKYNQRLTEIMKYLVKGIPNV